MITCHAPFSQSVRLLPQLIGVPTAASAQAAVSESGAMAGPMRLWDIDEFVTTTTTPFDELTMAVVVDKAPCVLIGALFWSIPKRATASWHQ